MRHALCAALVILGLAAPAAADPVTITSGFAVLTDEPGDFSLIGPGFDLSGEWFPRRLRGTFWFDRCGHPQLPGSPGGCLPGARIEFGSTTYGVNPDTGRGQGIIDGVVHDGLFFSGEWTFHGPSVVGPSGPEEPRLFRDGRFAFHGRIAAFLDESLTGTPLFSANLRGAGTARVFFGVETAAGGGPRLITHEMRYTFDGSQPVPEPSTMLLIGAGLAAGVTRLRWPGRTPQ
jgi:hypothetical protein